MGADYSKADVQHLTLPLPSCLSLQGKSQDNLFILVEKLKICVLEFDASSGERERQARQAQRLGHIACFACLLTSISMCEAVPQGLDVTLPDAGP